MRKLVVLLVLLGSLQTLGLASALAQSAPTPAPAVPATTVTPGSDIVRLTSGGFMRGTITEFVPGDYVVILTASGESKRFAAAEVSYAGPVAQDPTMVSAVPEVAAPPAVAPLVEPAPAPKIAAPEPVNEARFKFVGKEPGLMLHLSTGSEVKKSGDSLQSFKPLCAAPCDVSVPLGAHAFAVSKGALLPVSAPNTLDLKGGETVEASYQSRRNLRMLGKILFCVTIAVGIGVVAGDIALSKHRPNEGPLIGGLLVGIVGGLGGALLAMQPDRTALIEVRGSAHEQTQVTGKK